jgi:tRNA1Val (adenine37-N6)-methyltransferase
MGNKSEFRFKQFSVTHRQASMKVGTDAVLLGAWVDVKGAHRILDIGTGCGIISLLLAQRTSESTTIAAIEPEAAAVAEAIENVKQSPWPGKVLILQTTLQNFTPAHPYDLIVSNPPFFSGSQLPPAAYRERARHTTSLTHLELLQHSERLLAKGGTLAVVLPTLEGNRFMAFAVEKGWFVTARLAFFARASKPQERWVLELKRQPATCREQRLVLYQDGEQWTDDYRALISNFYLKA